MTSISKEVPECCSTLDSLEDILPKDINVFKAQTRNPELGLVRDGKVKV